MSLVTSCFKRIFSGETLSGCLFLGVLVSGCFPGTAMAAGDLPSVSVAISHGISEEAVSRPMQVAIIVTALSVLPAVLIMLTSFTRILIVLSMLRHAIGLQTIPPNIVIINLSLFLTLFVMNPALVEIGKNSITPYVDSRINASEAFSRGMQPIREFMLRQTREKDILLMIELSGSPAPSAPADIENFVLIPAFMISELQTAFQIGFIVFLPFLLIDLVVASILMSVGMIMVPPLTISLPIKILVFVLIDGWALLVKALVGSFAA